MGIILVKDKGCLKTKQLLRYKWAFDIWWHYCNTKYKVNQGTSANWVIVIFLREYDLELLLSPECADFFFRVVIVVFLTLDVAPCWVQIERSCWLLCLTLAQDINVLLNLTFIVALHLFKLFSSWLLQVYQCLLQNLMLFHSSLYKAQSILLSFAFLLICLIQVRVIVIQVFAILLWRFKVLNETLVAFAVLFELKRGLVQFFVRIIWRLFKFLLQRNIVELIFSSGLV